MFSRSCKLDSQLSQQREGSVTKKTGNAPRPISDTPPSPVPPAKALSAAPCGGQTQHSLDQLRGQCLELARLLWQHRSANSATGRACEKRAPLQSCLFERPGLRGRALDDSQRRLRGDAGDSAHAQPSSDPRVVQTVCGLSARRGLLLHEQFENRLQLQGKGHRHLGRLFTDGAPQEPPEGQAVLRDFQPHRFCK